MRAAPFEFFFDATAVLLTVVLGLFCGCCMLSFRTPRQPNKLDNSQTRNLSALFVEARGMRCNLFVVVMCGRYREGAVVYLHSVVQSMYLTVESVFYRQGVHVCVSLRLVVVTNRVECVVGVSWKRGGAL